MQYLTAWGGVIHAGGVSKGKTILITAASSSVGLAAIQIAEAAGAKVIAKYTDDREKATFTRSRC